MKKGLFLAGMMPLFICIGVISHEFWIQPAATHVLVGQRVPLQINIGEGFSGERWRGKGNRMVSYQHYSRNDVDDLLLSLEPGEGLVALPDFIASNEGTHMLTVSTNNIFNECPSKEFDEYLKEDGLMEAYKYRVANNEKFTNGREYYRRCAKVLIQVGDQTDNTYKEKTNLILDIIPDKNPYNHDRSEGLTFKVLYEGYPLPDAMVKWWHKDGDLVEEDFLFTSSKGEVQFSAAKPGLYMISTVFMERLKHDHGAEWQSTWSSLVFGIEE